MMTNDDSAFQIPPPSSAPAAPPAEGAAEPAEPAAPTLSFAELGLHADVLRALEEMGFQEPMPVQAATLPLVTEGRDLMVQSRTGSGKTAAFGIPFASSIVKPEDKFVQAIVLLPTRELALQVASELARICAYRGLTVVPVYGGAPMGRQVEQLHAGGQIVCGTPGRVLDHLRRGTLRLDRVRCAVLDECDEMLSMGFQEDIEDILEKTPTERQTMLFSATVPEGIQRLSRRYLRNPEFLKLSADYVGVHDIKHLYYSIPAIQREHELLQILAFEEPVSAIIFCNTREETGRVAEFLRQHGHDAEAISSDLSQSDRERVLGRMRAGGIKFLVATDVAARGIDIENLSHVFNYTFPESPEVYIHRTGRTGRAGRKGTAVSLIGPTEVGSFYYLKLLYKIKPEERALPSEAEIRSHREGERVLVLRRALTTEPGAEWRALARRLIGAVDGERLVAALLAHSFASVEGMPVAPVAVPVPAPRPAAASASPDSPRAERSERPYERGNDRPRPRDRDRDRGRPAYGDRPPRERPDREARGRREERGSREERGPRRPERHSPAPLRNDPPPAEREFWEVWSEERAQTGGQEGAGATAAPPPAPTAEGTPATESAPAVTDAPHSETPSDVTRLYLNLGRKDGASEREIRDLLTAQVGEVGVSEVDVMNTHTYLNVAPGDAEKIVAGLAGKELGGRQIVCETAKPRRR
ncbi:MAG TPA: DEAD/DEAH box helicase [Polyangia bacterium]|nr:DEAD/DEAH box helicase [Polyangia bacterium]